MAGLFQTAASNTNTLGDLKSDVELQNGPEDSISDIAFNPNQADAKDFLAVASWDKKVRVYEIMSNGQGQGKVAAESEGPVLSCDFFKVSFCGSLKFARARKSKLTFGFHRMVPKFSMAVQTRLPKSWISILASRSKSRLTTNQSAAFATSKPTAHPWQLRVPGTRQSSIGISAPRTRPGAWRARRGCTRWT